MAALTGLTVGTPDNSYLSLIKFSDNLPLTASLKALTDGQGNAIGIKFSTTQVSIDNALVMSSLAASKLVYLNASNILTTIADGTIGQALVTDGAGGYSFATVAGGGGITIGTTTVTGGATTQLLFNLAGVVSSSAGLTYASGLFTVLGTTQQAKFAYDASNHLGITIGSTGNATYALTGTSPVNIFNQSVGIGVSPTNAKLELLSTTEIMRLQYNSTNYTSLTPTSIGDLNVALEGTFPAFSMQTRYSGANYATFRFDTPSGASVKGYLTITNTNGTGGVLNTSTQPLSLRGSSILAENSGNNPTNIFTVNTGTSTNHTSGTFDNVTFKVTTFNPTSGSVPMNNLLINGTINQTGSASGITRSLYINQTLTAAADYRAIEVARGLVLFTHTSQQLKVAYDSSNHAGFTVASNGDLTIALTGTTPTVKFSTKVQLSDVDLVLGTTTGSKIGSTSSQKLAFWGKTPIVQPTTAIARTVHTSVGGTVINDNDTFGGYTLDQAITALINCGILA